MPQPTLIDRPVQALADESLGLKSYAIALAEFIRHCETPVTIGIQGDWGIGKTSLLNMVSELLAEKQGGCSWPTLYINTWQYAQLQQHHELPLVILQAIVKAIEARFTKKRWTEKAGAAAGWLAGTTGRALNQLTASRTGIDVYKAAGVDEPEAALEFSHLIVEYKVRFAELVAEVAPPGKGHLVVMIEDLDRVAPARALELLEAVKIFLDVPQCVFVLAVDYAVVQRGVAEKLGATTQELHGKSYFDKIIQVPFNMPVGAYQVDRYIMQLLGWEKKPRGGYQRTSNRGSYIPAQGDVTQSDADFFTNITRLTVGQNPRSIKRAVNYAKLLRIIVRQRRAGSRVQWKKSDAQLLYPLACMQLAWPELFAWFCQNPTPEAIQRLESWEFLATLPEAQRIFARAHDLEQTKANIAGFFDELKGLLDANEDGIIQPGEFKPIWSMMEEANLTSVALGDLDKSWDELRRLVHQYWPKAWNKGSLDRWLGLFRESRSRWSNRVHFRLIRAGKRFFNLAWDGRQLGSIVSTKGRPMAVYLVVPGVAEEDAYRVLLDRLGSKWQPYLENWWGHGHYGSGSVLLKHWELNEREDRFPMMNELLAALLGQTVTVEEEEVGEPVGAPSVDEER
jgi:hypothetical protein